MGGGEAKDNRLMFLKQYAISKTICYCFYSSFFCFVLKILESGRQRFRGEQKSFRGRRPPLAESQIKKLANMVLVCLINNVSADFC